MSNDHYITCLICVIVKRFEHLEKSSNKNVMHYCLSCVMISQSLSVFLLPLRLPPDHTMSDCEEESEDVAVSPVPSCLSMKSDDSKENPPNINNEPRPLDTK